MKSTRQRGEWSPNLLLNPDPNLSHNHNHNLNLDRGPILARRCITVNLERSGRGTGLRSGLGPL
jgi:hypothetical protein